MSNIKKIEYEVYDKDYYDNYLPELSYTKNPHWEVFFDRIAEKIKNEINPKTVLDVGCAKGFLVEKLRERGIDAHGIDISEYAISQVDESIKKFCKVGSILEKFDRKYDLIICIEVIEHLYEEDSKKALNNLCNFSDDIIFSSTPDGHEEKTHHNVQFPSYWINLFAEKNFFRDTKFDATFISTWAGRFKKYAGENNYQILGDYENKFWELNQEKQNLTENIQKSENIHKLDKQPLIKLLQVYNKRKDLQEQFPEVMNSNYKKLIFWSKDVVLEKIEDSSMNELKHISDWLINEVKNYDNLQNGIQEIESANEEKIQEIESANEEKIQEIESANEEKIQEIESANEEKIQEIESANEEKIQEGINQIKTSLAYTTGLYLLEFCDKYFSPNKKFGRTMRKILGKIYVNHYNSFQKNNVNNKFGFENQYVFDDFITDEQLKLQLVSLEFKPKISIIMPVYNSNVKFLEKAINSVKKQYYTNWQLCICDDKSNDDKVLDLLKKYKGEENIEIIFSEKNSGISIASNKALEIAKGEYTILLDHDDLLSKHALLEIVKMINKNKNIEFIYSDEDKIDEQDNHMTPFFKPDWSPELFFSYNYPIHVSMFKTKILNEVGGFRKEFDGAQDYDLILRYLEKINHIQHIPKVLYSWRKSKGSTALSPNEKNYAFDAGKNALNEMLKRRKIDAQCEEGIQKFTYRIKYKINKNPLISIIIPSRNITNITTCVESIFKISTYTNFEIIVLDSSIEDKIKKYCNKFDKIKIVKFESKFNFSKFNNDGVKQSNGEYIIFLNDDTKIITPGWIESMLEHSQHNDIGITGCKLLYKNEMVQHAGTIIGIQNHAGNYGGMHKDEEGYFSFAKIIRNCSAVTAACMMMKKEFFEKIGGFDEELERSWQDVDLCIRVIKTGKRIIFTPYSVLYHFEGATRGNTDSTEEELIARKLFREKNLEFITKGDPHYNPNLSLWNPFKIRKTMFAPLQNLFDIYEGRKDLQDSFPNDHNNKFRGIIDWVVTHGIVADSSKEILALHYEYYFKNCSDSAKPLANKIKQYLESKELQKKFPEVPKGDFERFLKATN